MMGFVSEGRFIHFTTGKNYARYPFLKIKGIAVEEIKTQSK
jgi:hypothetical protein